MKATGIVRRVDNLGRVVIPMETRKVLQINEGDPLEIFVDRDGEIILKKYVRGCVFCGETEVVECLGKDMCKECRLIIASSV